VTALEQLAADARARATARRAAPGATYRLQFHAGFTLRDAARLVPYYAALGITHLYASPLLTARPGSTHGYDITDHDRLNPEIGTEADLAALAAALRARGMGLILDVVPNHMCVTGDNAWWADVLEHGPSSPFAGHFDIAWNDAPRADMHGRLLLPVLGEPYGQILEAGQLQVRFERGRFVVKYWDATFPLDPRTYGQLLTPALDALRAAAGPDADVVELRSIRNAVRHLPPRDEADLIRVSEGRTECGVIRRRLSELAGKSPPAAAAVRDALAKLSGTPGDPASFAPLDSLLESQAYRLSFWRVASDEINYRRFFDVNELAALSTEREDVFRAVHRKWLGWVADGHADGLRIDHPDGLFDPKQYLDRLQSHYLLAVAERLLAEHPQKYDGVTLPRDEWELLRAFAEPTPPAPLPEGKGEKEPSRAESATTAPSSSSPSLQGGGWGVGSSPLYVVVEKILGDGERLPANWVCDGTAGYEFAVAVNGLFVDPSGEAPLTSAYQRFTGLDEPFHEVAHNGKLQIQNSSLASELWALAHQLDRLARLDRRSRDFTLNGIRRALREVIACFPVYRSYVNGAVHTADTAAVVRAVVRARKRNPTLGKPLFDFVRDTVLLKDSPSGPATDEYRQLQRRFAGKFQQVTAPVTAKGVEDTALYVYNRLGSLNEVGGEPGRFGWSAERVHKFMAERRAEQPGGLSPLSTHDTKRSEDVRARLNVLSELPEDWAQAVSRWAEMNRPHKVAVADSDAAPDANEEWLLYQTLVGVWDGPPTPEFVARVQAYMKKALAEAKVHSSWINPDAEYENAVADFVAKILDSREFVQDFDRFAGRVAAAGRVNSLAQTLLRCTLPGVPDTYQGAESWDFSLVDPDNRRPVDYAARAAALAELDAADRPPAADDPRAKLFVTVRALNCRKAHAKLFAEGEYVPLPATGEHADRVFAFARVLGGSTAVVAVPRFTAGLKSWGDTALPLPPGRYTNALTGGRLEGAVGASELFAALPAALLVPG
jgi:(1->4)-alpha-D-glucan 1-alpha-D-glucosylmutase